VLSMTIMSLSASLRIRWAVSVVGLCLTTAQTFLPMTEDNAASTGTWVETFPGTSYLQVVC